MLLAGPLLVLLSVLLPAVFAKYQCQFQGRDCEWYGDNHECGTTPYSIGDFDENLLQLVTWSKDDDPRVFCSTSSNARYPGSDCCYPFRRGAFFCKKGTYKRLWCKPEAVSCRPREWFGCANVGAER